MGRDVRKPVRLKTACSMTESSYNIEISPVARLDMILSSKRIIKGADQTARMQVLIRLCRCASWSSPLLLAKPKARVSQFEAQIRLHVCTILAFIANTH